MNTFETRLAKYQENANILAQLEQLKSLEFPIGQSELASLSRNWKGVCATVYIQKSFKHQSVLHFV